MIATPGLTFRDHVVAVPLDHARPGGPSIDVFAREVVAAGREGETLPWLLFLQGGPGGKSPRPLAADGWIGRAVETHRVLLLDQRGTGRSTPDLRAYGRRAAGCGARRSPAALPGRQHRGRRRDSARADRRWGEVGHPRAELRRLRHPDLPLPGARGPAHLLRHRRPAGDHRHRRRRVRPHLPAGRRQERRVLPVLTRRTPPPFAGSPTISTTHEVLLPDGDRLTVRAFPGPRQPPSG